MNKLFKIIALMMLALPISQASAQQAVAYYGLEPDIVTNYLSTGAKNLGYVRITVELLLEDVDDIEIAEHHSPLLRSTAIEIFGRQPEDKIKSLTGREDIRRMCLETLRALMKILVSGLVGLPLTTIRAYLNEVT
jgi:flagellar FliL protein